MKRKFVVTVIAVCVAAMQLSACGNSTETKDSVRTAEQTSSQAVEASVTELTAQAEIGVEYTAAQLCKSLALNSELTIGFEDDSAKRKFTELGEQTVGIYTQDKEGKRTSYIVKVTVREKKMPVFEGVHDITVNQGEKPDLKQGVSVKDSFGNELEFTVEYDADDKDPDAPGKHNITYSVDNGAGGKVTVTATVEVKAVVTTTGTTTVTTTAATKAATTAKATQATTRAAAASSANVELYKKNLVVAGDSIAYGFCAYGYIPYEHNIAKGSMAMRNYTDTSLFTFDPTGTRLSCMDAIAAVKPKLLYVSMGMNDINITNAQTYANNYVGFLKKVRARVPGCIIVAANITPTEAKRTDFSVVKIKNCNNLMQSAVQAMNDPNIILFDAYSVVSAGGTYMAGGYGAGDGLHLAGFVYQRLLNALAVRLDQYGVSSKL